MRESAFSASHLGFGQAVTVLLDLDVGTQGVSPEYSRGAIELVAGLYGTENGNLKDHLMALFGLG